ncbi:MAG TPA: phage terminase large subunit [Candidatus Kapabacteria bacterium]|nr:phage terminase large subunit [Candidatus Kapabacteria bacterium]
MDSILIKCEGALNATPDQRPYTPYGGALDLFDAREREVLIEGPAGTGKTRAVLEKIYLLATKHAGIRVLVCRKSRSSMTESVLVTWEEKVVPAGDPCLFGVSGRRLQRSQRRSYWFSNGSQIVVAGIDDNADVMSTEFDVIAAFEATQLAEADWDALLTRLRNGRMPYQQLIGDCNPGRRLHWLNQRCLRGDMRRIHSRHADNPSATNEYVESLGRLRGARRLRLLLGLWADQEGLVYETWDPQRHVVPTFTIPGNWRRICSVDFGFVNPAVCHWYAVAPSGRLVLYREYYRSRRLVPDFARDIVALSAGEQIERTVCDWDAAERADLEAAGIRCTLAYKQSVVRGIEAVQERLGDMGDGRPGLVVLRDALVRRDEALAEEGRPCSVIEEMESYAWPLDREGRARKELPVQIDDHGVDALRYAVCYVDGTGTKAAGLTWA